MIKKGYVLLALLLMLPMLCWADPININTADAEQIAQTMKGIGSSKATAIVEYRERHGLFKSIEELSSVKGIGEKTVEQNREVITINIED